MTREVPWRAQAQIDEAIARAREHLERAAADRPDAEPKPAPRPVTCEHRYHIVTGDQRECSECGTPIEPEGP